MGKMGNGIDESNLEYLMNKMWQKCLNTFMMYGGANFMGKS